MSVELGDSYEAIYQQAHTDMELGNQEQAVSALQRIVNRLVRLRPQTIERKPDLQTILFRAWEDLVTHFRQKERFDEAIALCEQVADHLPGESLAALRMASLRIARGEVEQGLADLQEIAAQEQTFSAWYTLGVEYAQLDRHQEAIAALRNAIAHAAGNRSAATANLTLFEVYQELGQTSNALSAWNMAVVLNPDLAAESELVYRWLIERGELEQAGKYLRRENNAMRRAFYQGHLDHESGREGAARSQWQRVLNMDPHAQEADIAVWLEAVLRLGESQRALEEVEHLSAHGHPFSAQAHFMVGVAHAMLGELDEAGEWFDVALQQRQSMGFREKGLDTEDRALFELLVTDPDRREALASYWQE